MTVDAGMSELMQRMHAAANGGPGLGVEAGASLEIQIGRLAAALERQEKRRQLLAQAVAPVRLPPLDFTVTGGVAKFKAHRAAATDQSPSEGYMWFVQRLTLAGLNAGDLVNLFRTASSTLTGNAIALHTFTGPASVGAGLGTADWEPGSLGLPMWPDDNFYLVSAGTLAASEIILSGDAIQVDVNYLAEYLL